MSNIVLLKVASEAEGWRDISPCMQRKETALRISLLVLTLLTLIATAISIYYCLPGVIDGYAMSGALMFASCLIGFLVAGSLFSGFICIDFEKCKRGFSPKFKKPGVIEKHFKFLTTKSLHAIYEKYDHHHGGLGPLVRIGLLTKDEGERLRSIFNEIKSLKTTSNKDLVKDEIQAQWREIGQLEIKKLNLQEELC